MGMNSLDASINDPCPGQRVIITAVTDAPAGNIEWNVGAGPHDTFVMVDGQPLVGTLFDGNGNLILPPGVSDATGDTITVRGIGGETRVITGTHGNPLGDPPTPRTSLTVIVSWRLAEVTLELVPPPPYVITATPQMPSISVIAHSAGGSASGLTLQARVMSTFHDCPPHQPVHLDTVFEVPIGPGGSLDFGDVIRGSVVVVSASGMINGCDVSASVSGGMDGTNPLRTDIGAALPHETLRRIACKESGQRQFDALPNGGHDFCPLFGPTGKVGVMQIPEPTPDEVWNWRLNVAKGIELFEQKVAEAAAYPARVRSSSRFLDSIAAFNANRQQQGLAAISVVLPDFTTGDFDTDLQQLELDAIRGYDGWFGGDGFGHELHEFRVGTEDNGQEQLIVENIDELGLTGLATWTRVQPGDRPTAPGDPDYVEAVNALSVGCGQENGGDEHLACHGVRISTSGPALRFNPPSDTAVTVVAGTVGGGIFGSMQWCLKPVDGYRGTVTADVAPVGNGNEATLRARHPGKLRLRFQRGDCAGVTVPPTCFADVDLSVPHFFFLRFEPSFDIDLARLGLMRRSNPDGSSLTLEQMEVNDRVRSAVITAALRTAKNNYDRVNARFVLTSPEQLVGPGNFTMIRIGGLDDDSANTEYGFCERQLQDPFNPDKLAKVFAGEFTRRGGFITSHPIYRAIFDTLATEDANASALGGTPVNAGDFFVGVPTRRELIVRAGVLAFANFVGTIASHEAGHALIPTATNVDPHGVHEPNSLMQGGGLTFEETTAIVAFDPSRLLLTVTDPIRFGPWFRQRLTHRYPTEDIFLSEFD